MSLPASSAMAFSVVTDEGAWCWFADPRALHHENKALGIDKTYIGSIDNLGNIKAEEYDFNKGTKETVLIRSWFQPDDHDNPTFIALPDGRVVVFYSRHTDEPCFYYRVTDKSGSLATLGDEKILATENNTTYPSPFLLSDDEEHIYLCWRGINWHPTIGRLTMPDEEGNMKFDRGPKQIVQSSGARPYAKYNSNGKDRIFLTYTTGHPDNELPNHLYYNVIDALSGDVTGLRGKKVGNVWEQEPFRVDKTAEFVNFHRDMLIDAPDSIRDWVWQLAFDSDGNPAVAMTEISPDKKSHSYYLARYDGMKWNKRFVADGGGWFHESDNIEHCYSGGMAIDPDNVNVVYCSVPVKGKYGETYEIVKYVLDDLGNVVSNSAITTNSAKSNARPYVIPGSLDSPLRLAWMYGNYYDWIVSRQRPSGYDTSIITDYEGLPSATAAYTVSENWNPAVNDECMYEMKVTLADFTKGNPTAELGKVTYSIDSETYFPTISYDGRSWKGVNRVATAEGWQRANRATDGKWPLPAPYDAVDIRLTLKDGVMRTYINGMLDQTVTLR